jgi:hypothetical protein
VLAALSASLEGPRLAHQPLTTVTAELTAAPSAIAHAATNVAANVTGDDASDDSSHLGFDTNVYPGDRAMAAWKRFGEYEWVGYYLRAQCHKDDSWSGTRQRLTDAGWGLAVIYVGQQTWGKSYGPVKVKKRVLVKKNGRRHYVTRTMTRKSSVPVATSADGCSSSFVNAAQGTIDGRDAVRKAAREGFPNGTVIFLDIEHMDGLPQRMRDYYRKWTRTVLADGRYRPGVYAHTQNAATIFDDVSAEYDRAGVSGDPPFWIAGSSGFSIASMPTEVGHAFATAWQGALDVVRSHNGVRLPIDISVASVPSPSDVQAADVR